MTRPTRKSQRQIEYVELDVLKPAKRNPKAHALDSIGESFNRFGYVEGLVRDDRTGRLVAGHGRLEELQALKKAGYAAPDGITVDAGGAWLVPVQTGWRSKNDDEAEAYLIASNRIPELGGWDKDGLNEALKGLAERGGGAEALLGTGYQPDFLARLMGTEAAEDLTEPVPEPWVKVGQLFKLGDHRIICGDATNADVVKRLLGDLQPNLMVTDPPYGVEYDPQWRTGIAGNFGNVRGGELQGDDRIDWLPAWQLFPGDVAYVWHAGLYAGDVGDSLLKADFVIRSQIIWRKPFAPMSRGAYHWQHEPCWYVVRKGAKASWVGDRKQTTVWDAVSPGNPYGRGEAPADVTVHGTQKPIELYRRPILNHTARGDFLYEPFSGSGTAIVACEQLERRCLAVELDPRYVQAAIERWEKITQKKHEEIT